MFVSKKTGEEKPKQPLAQVYHFRSYHNKINKSSNSRPGKIISALVMNIFSIITAIIAVVLIFIELSKFKSVSYRNYGQAKLGREVSRVLLFSYPLEFVTAFVYAVCSCSHLSQKREEHPTPVTEEVESTF
nr:membrane-spanning 4-domains subfamily A member 13 isoform X3 [Oryctolagus cuniculus]